MTDVAVLVSDHIAEKYGVRIPVRTSSKLFDSLMKDYIEIAPISSFNRPYYERVIFDFPETVQQTMEQIDAERFFIRRHVWNCPSFGYTYLLPDTSQMTIEEEKAAVLVMVHRLAYEAFGFFIARHTKA